LQILLQDKYNIGVLTVNIEFMWLGTKRMERLTKARLSSVSKPRHIQCKFYIYRQYTNIVYVYDAFLEYPSSGTLNVERLERQII